MIGSFVDGVDLFIWSLTAPKQFNRCHICPNTQLSGAQLKEKAEWVLGAMKRQADGGELTKGDKEKLLAQVTR